MRTQPFAAFFSLCLAISSPGLAQNSPHAPDNNPTYQLLRHLLPGGETATVQEFTLKRDAATFTFHSGSFAFYDTVNGRISGAVFRGHGSLHITPPTPEEKRSLNLLTKAAEYDESFDSAILRFTDDTATEIQKAATGKGPAAGSDTSAGQQFVKDLRTQLHWNLDERLLEDLMNPASGGFFLASLEGKKYASKTIFMIDPRGANGVLPEEVELMTWNDLHNGIWMASHYANEYRDGIAGGNEANDAYAIDHQDLDTTIAKNGALTGTAKTIIRAREDGLIVVPLRLYATLRVSSVQIADGAQLDFIQENKDEDPDFAVILPAPLKKDQKIELRITYSGKGVVSDEGSGNYYLNGGARESWYPSAREGGLSSYATYHMLFHVPKGLDLIATGKPVHSITDGGANVTEWTSDVPIPVAGFNLGHFQKEETTLKNGFIVDAYANTDLPDNIASLRNFANGDGAPRSGGIVGATPQMALGSMSTTSMLKPALSQGQVAVEIYTAFFGPLQFNNLALTQQTACNYGQSWPMLIYLPICGFWDRTVQHELGLDSNTMYWKVVTPHEVAHQWWGQTVSFRSYRDQWMSEGFADFSASIFLQVTNKSDKEYRDFWQQERKLITEKNKDGFRPIDVGPVTMGYRLVNSRSGENIYRDLVYPKGAYILHMIRMMTYDRQTGDKWLQDTLHDFITSYREQPATTEDFKAILEKHMTPALDLDGNHRLDWFFNEYVYGTTLPHYEFTSELKPDATGTQASFKLTQSSVDASFKMLVPLYAELNDGRIVRLGSASIYGNSSVEKQLHFPVSVKRLMINYAYDVLCIQN